MKEYKLKDVCNLITCGVAKRPDYFEQGIPFLSSKNVKANRIILNDYKFISKKAHEELTKNNKPEKGDILYTRVGSFGEAAINNLDFEFSVFVSLTLIKPKHEIINNKYLMYFLNSPVTQALAKKSTTGSGVQNLNVNTVREFKITLPKMEDQLRVANILSRAEAIIAERKQSINLLAKLLKSSFLELFGDPVKNEKKWAVEKLDNLCSVIADIDHKMPKAIEEGGYPFISAKDLLDDGTISFDDVKRISEKDFRHLARKIKPQKGDIIYSRIGAKLGKARIVKVDFDFVASYSCCTIRPNKDRINTVFLNQLLDSPYLLRQALKDVRAIGVPDLGMDKIRNFNIILPPMKLQTKFAKMVVKIEELKNEYNAHLNELTNLYGSLGQSAFRGELNLSKLSVEHIIPHNDGGTFTTENVIVLPAKDNKAKTTKIGKVTVENLYEDGIAKLIKKHFKHLDFRFSEIIKMLEDEEAIAPTYYTTEELKRLTVPNPIDIQTFIFDCVQGKNKHLKLEQKFYNYFDDYELKNIILKENKEELAKKLIGSPPQMTGDDINGIYFRIIE